MKYLFLLSAILIANISWASQPVSNLAAAKVAQVAIADIETKYSVKCNDLYERFFWGGNLGKEVVIFGAECNSLDGSIEKLSARITVKDINRFGEHLVVTSLKVTVSEKVNNGRD
jgi:hypothetical protein